MGGGAAAAAGVLGGLAPSTRQGRTVLHRLGFYSPDASVPASELPVEDVRLPSGRAAAVVRVGSSSSGEPTSAVVCLHGRNGDHRFAFDTIRLHDFAASLELDLVIAALDGGPSSYWHRRADGTDPLRSVVEELVPLVRGRNGGGPLAIIGWSMGGYGALLATLRHPDLFTSVVAASPAVFRRYEDAAAGAFDGPDDFRAHDVLAEADVLRRLPVRIDCGRDDPFASVSRELVDRLDAAGGIHDGFHEAGLWRSLARHHLRFVAPAPIIGRSGP